jgi:predicted GIY-YIG superfamily endonuclease
MPDHGFVYRAYSAAGDLLYVGVTGDVERRMSEHSARSPWYRQYARMTITGYATRAEADRAEAEALLTEWPPFNRYKVRDRLRGSCFTGGAALTGEQRAILLLAGDDHAAGA